MLLSLLLHLLLEILLQLAPVALEGGGLLRLLPFVSPFFVLSFMLLFSLCCIFRAWTLSPVSITPSTGPGLLFIHHFDLDALHHDV